MQAWKTDNKSNLMMMRNWKSVVCCYLREEMLLKGVSNAAVLEQDESVKKEEALSWIIKA